MCGPAAWMCSRQVVEVKVERVCSRQVAEVEVMCVRSRQVAEVEWVHVPAQLGITQQQASV